MNKCINCREADVDYHQQSLCDKCTEENQHRLAVHCALIENETIPDPFTYFQRDTALIVATWELSGKIMESLQQINDGKRRGWRKEEA
jgi:hypothetical protein